MCILLYPRAPEDQGQPCGHVTLLTRWNFLRIHLLHTNLYYYYS